MGIISARFNVRPVARATFDPDTVVGFGVKGQDLARAMCRAMARADPHWQLSYNTTSRKFTVLGTNNVSLERMSTIFRQRAFDNTGGCESRVLGRNAMGNIVVVIQDITSRED